MKVPHLDGPRTAPLTTLGAALLTALVGRLQGVEGAPLGALLAGVLVLAFFWIGAIPLLLVGGDLSLAGPGFLLLMTTYVLRLVGLSLVLALAGRSEAVDLPWLAGTLIACTLVWVLTSVALVGRSRVTL